MKTSMLNCRTLLVGMFNCLIAQLFIAEAEAITPIANDVYMIKVEAGVGCLNAQIYNIGDSLSTGTNTHKWDCPGMDSPWSNNYWFVESSGDNEYRFVSQYDRNFCLGYNNGNAELTACSNNNVARLSVDLEASPNRLMFKELNTNNCLAMDPAGNYGNGSNIQFVSCAFSSFQIWSLHDALSYVEPVDPVEPEPGISSDVYMIKVEAGQGCLNTQIANIGDTVSAGVNLHKWDCPGMDSPWNNNYWFIDSTGDNEYRFISQYNREFCLGYNAGNAELTRCGDTNEARLTVEQEASPNRLMFKEVNTNTCLAMDPNGYYSNGSNIQFSPCTFSSFQLWGLHQALTDPGPAYTKMVNPSNVNYAHMGGAIATYGDFTVVGANEDGTVNGVRNYTGAAYLYHKGILVRTLQNQDTNHYYRFMGRGVAISSQWVAASGSGGVHSVFLAKKVGDEYQALSYEITSPQFSMDHLAAIDLYENTLVVGSPGNNSVFIYVYQESSDTWQLADSLSLNDGSDGDFGSAVAISRDHIIVGAPAHNNSTGRVFIYEKSSSSNSWSLSHAHTSSSVYTGTNYGDAVDISGGQAVVSAPGFGGSQGFAEILVNNNGSWQAETGRYGVGGTSVAVHENSVAVGDRWGQKVYYLEKQNNQWTDVATIEAAEIESGDAFGYAIDIHDSYLSIGARQDNKLVNGDVEYNVGSAYNYVLDDF